MSIFTSKAEKQTLTIYGHGRLDATVASAAEEEIASIRTSSSDYESVVLDVEDLQYISSAGLRILLRLRKDEPSLKIINATTEIYEILEMTGFTEMIPVEKACRKLSVEGCEVIGEGAKGTVYRYDPETIVKVFKSDDCIPDIKRERDLARKAFINGIPTAISYDMVKVDGKYGSVFELLDCKSLTKVMSENTDNLDKYIKMFADLLKQVHAVETKPGDFPNSRELIEDRILNLKGVVSDEDWNMFKALCDALPDSNHLLHYDYHANNIMVQGDEMLLIDMDTLCCGEPVLDLCNTYVAYVGFGELDKSMVENFLKMPYETTKYIWKKFLEFYMGTDDPEVLIATENKTKVLAYARLVNRCNHKAFDGIDYFKEKFHEALTSVDTLVI